MKITKRQLRRIIRETLESTPGDWYRQKADKRREVENELSVEREVLADMVQGTPEHRAQFDVVQKLEKYAFDVGYVGD